MPAKGDTPKTKLRSGTWNMFRPVFPLLVFLLAITNCPAAWQVIMAEGRRHVPIEDVSRFYQLPKPIKNGRFFEIIGKGRKIRGEIGKREIFINNVKYVLCFPIRERNGSILISAMDVTKII